MQKILFTLFSLSVLCSCDYSTSSNGNIDAAFARETQPANTHGEEHHGNVDAAEHKNNDAHDHVEGSAKQDDHDALVVPTDTSEYNKGDHSAEHGAEHGAEHH